MAIKNLKTLGQKSLFNKILHISAIGCMIFLLYYLIDTSSTHMRKQEDFYKTLETYMQSEENSFDSIDTEITQIHIKIDSLLCH